MADLENLAFQNEDGTTHTPPEPLEPITIQDELKEGEVLVDNIQYPSSFTPHLERPKRQKRQVYKRERPPLLSPREKRDLLDQRRENLTASKHSTKTMPVHLPLDMYERLVKMAENEAMTGSFKHSFNYFVAWCVFAGLKYYETYGLTHNNPDKINFKKSRETSGGPVTPTLGTGESDETSFIQYEDDTRRMPDLGAPRDMAEALQKSVMPVAPIHPILGRMRPPNPLRVPGDTEMSPAPTQEDLDREAMYWRQHAEREPTPAILKGEPAFDREAIRESVRSFLPASADR